MTSEQAAVIAPPAAVPTIVVGTSGGGGSSTDVDGDFVGSWITTQATGGEHDPALVALLATHRKKESVSETALLKALAHYAQQLDRDKPVTSRGGPSEAPAGAEQ